MNPHLAGGVQTAKRFAGLLEGHACLVRVRGLALERLPCLLHLHGKLFRLPYYTHARAHTKKNEKKKKEEKKETTRLGKKEVDSFDKKKRPGARGS